MDIKKILPIVLILIFLGTFASATESISGLTVNTPIPIDKDLVLTGTYDDTDSNVSVYCKFLVLDFDKNAMIDRFTDELTFADGSFFTKKTLTEPKFFRETTYALRVTCGTATEDINFFIGQREMPTNQVLGEVFFLRDNGDILIILFLFVVIILIIVGALVILINQGYFKGNFLF